MGGVILKIYYLLFIFASQLAQVAELVDLSADRQARKDSKSQAKWTYINCRSGGIGRHDGFKIHCSQRRAGSIPAFGTKNNSLFLREFFMYYVYAISSINKNYIYVGITNNLDRRLSQHYNGYEKTTKPYLPFKLIYKEKCDSRIDARIHEKYWKSGIGKEKLRKISINL